MATFTPKITKARVVLSPFTSEQMKSIGDSLATSIIKRIKSGKNANDQTAKPLKQPPPGSTSANLHLPASRYYGYPARKLRMGLQPIRDWVYSGQTMRSLKTLSANENGGKIGFTTARANKIAAILNTVDKAFGISPTDRVAMNDGLHQVLTKGPMIQVKQVA